jgi:hypothetical protein
VGGGGFDEMVPRAQALGGDGTLSGVLFHVFLSLSEARLHVGDVNNFIF